MTDKTGIERNNKINKLKILKAAQRPELITFLLLIICFWVSTVISPYFLDADYILDSTTLYNEFGIMAIAMTFIIIAGQIDLSVASMMALTSCLTAMLFHGGISMEIAILLGLFIGIGLGAINGALVAFLDLPPLIVTIGSMALFRGVAQIFIGDHSLSDFPEWFIGADKLIIPGTSIPWTLIMFILMALGMGLLLSKTKFGRHVYAIGTNENAANYAAVPVKRLKIILFALSGLFAAIGGILTMSRLAVVRYDMALGGELDIITIVLLGGTDINGGKGGMLGTFLGMLVLTLMRTGMGVARVKVQYQMAIMGALLIISIIIPNIVRIIKDRND